MASCVHAQRACSRAGEVRTQRSWLSLRVSSQGALIMGEEGDAFEESNVRREGRTHERQGEEKVTWEQCCKIQKALLFAAALIFPSFVEI